jgi:1-deoxy-D-xylulose-5-phosphate synthase
MTPSDEDECRKMLTTAYRLDGPGAVRYPRGTGSGAAIDKALVGLPVGKGEIRRRGQGVALLAFGSMLTPALAAAENSTPRVANMRFVKPIDRELILALAAEHSLLVSVEENAVIGGAGSEVARVLEEIQRHPALLRWGFPTASSNMATRHCCWPKSVWTATASSGRYAHSQDCAAAGLAKQRVRPENNYQEQQ